MLKASKSQLKILALIFFCYLAYHTNAIGVPIEFKDSTGKLIELKQQPKKVVSLIPEITEILFKIGAGKNLIAVTRHDSSYPSGAAKKSIIGGFFSPNLETIAKQNPDLIITHSLQKEVRKRFQGKVKLIELNTHSPQKLYSTIKLLGNIFDQQEKAKQLIRNIKNDLFILSRKIAKIPENKRKRVIRIMGRNKVMAPGDDSFMNDIIRKAGGIAPKFGKKGAIITLTKKEWMKFNPQIIYACGDDRIVAKKFFNLPGWKDVEAVKNKKIIYYPCALTCRHSTNIAYFASWMASNIYRQEFFAPENQLIKNQLIKKKKLDIKLDYVKRAEVAEHYLYDIASNSLAISLTKPMKVISTLVGSKENITTIGNGYTPPQAWGFTHKNGFDEYRNSLYRILGKNPKQTSFLFTGVSMKDLAVVKKTYKNLTVYVLATAGTESNAMKAGTDKGHYYKPGTINILVLTNKKLTSRAMSRSIISVTEGKNAAIKDLDIRSAYSPAKNQATGTGTDNVLVVEGQGQEIDYAGGHSKIAELISTGAYEAVKKSLLKHGGFYAGRSVFLKLEKRKLSLYSLVSDADCGCTAPKTNLVAKFEALLLKPRYAGFIESAFALSDAYEQGLITDISSFKTSAKIIAEEIAGHPIKKINNYFAKKEIPAVMKISLNAIFNGVYQKK